MENIEVVVPLYKNCRRCGKKLRSLDSQKLGYGKICYKKYCTEDKYRMRLFQIRKNE